MATIDLLQLLGESLLSSDGNGVTKSIPTADLRGKTVGVYFSAHWCPPCRQFTPVLIKTYNKLRSAGKDFEVVFVSSDKNQQQFEDYFSHMPWRAVPYSDTATRNKLSRQFNVMGIPMLAIVSPDGRILTNNGRAAVMRDPEGASYPWEGAKAGWDGLLGSPLVLLLLFVACWKLAQWIMGLRQS